MQTAEVGYFQLSVDGKLFNLVASLRNMAKIADSKRILTVYDMIHSQKIPTWLKLELGRDILLACSDSEAIDNYLIKCRKQKPHLKTNSIAMNDQIVVAAALMRHGVAGVNRPDYAKPKGKSKPLERFDINKIVSDAMIAFGLSKSEALDLTMSEFCHLLAAKFPPESASNDSPSIEDHKAAMKALMEKNNG